MYKHTYDMASKSKIIKHFITQTLHLNVCRICLSDDKNTLESIHQLVQDDSDLTMLKIIEDIAQIQVNLKNGLPLVMCLECKEKATIAHMFREECRKSDAMFQDTMNQLYLQVIDIDEDNLEDGQSIIIVVDELAEFQEIVKKEDESEKNGYLEQEEIYHHGNSTKQEANDLQTFLSTNEIDSCVVKQEGYFRKIDEHFLFMQCDQDLFEENFNNLRTDEKTATHQEPLEQISNAENVDSNHKLQRCSLCDEKFVSSERLKRHVLNHERSKTKPICDLCGKSFCNMYHLVNHKKRIHTNKSRVKYTCQYCGKSYKGQNSFDSHIARHEGRVEPKKEKTPNAICDYCGISYTVKFLLEQHILGKHFNIRPHECHECGKCFRSLGTLKGHRIVHTREREYICSTCNKGFVDRRAYYLHSRLHTGEKPFSCDSCGRSFVSSNRRNTHMLTAHTLPNKKCPLCPSMFHLQSMVNTHLKKVHMRAHRRKRTPYDETTNLNNGDISYMDADDII